MLLTMKHIVMLIARVVLFGCVMMGFGLMEGMGQSAPTITNFAPTVQKPGSTITIEGTGFSATNTQNVVRFGSTRAFADTAAVNGTSLSVTVPVGATNGPISVTNLTTGLSAYSRKHFVPTFTGNAGTMRFSDKGLLESSKSEHISLSDLDGDGKSDLIVCQSGNVYVYQNQSLSGSLTTSSFGSKVGISFGGSVRSQLIGDLDGDGKPDIVALYSNGVDVFRNVHVSGSISGSSFDTPLTLAVGNNPGTVTLSDFDGDGKPDLVVTNTGDNTLSLFLNTSVSGTLSFASPVLLNTGLNPMYSTSGDIDGDGLSDLVLLRSETVTLLRNVSTPGNISFSSGYDISMAGIGPNGILLTDLDVDGKPDLLTCNSGNSVSVFRNTGVSAPFGSGSFSTRVDFSTDISNNIRMSVGDLDGDGLPDISLGRNDGFVGGMNVGSLSVPVLRNTSTSGTISFGSVVTIPITEDRPGAAVIGDLDGDKVPDLVVGGTDMGKLYVLRNANLDPVSLPPPAVSSFTPTSGAVGTPVTISGSEFSTTASDNVVTFGTVRVVASSSTATSLTVTVPAGAVYGPLTVTRLDRNLSGRSSASFIPTFTGTPGSVEYLPRVDKGTGDGPQSSVLSDLDGDGKAELLTGNWSGGSVSVFQNASVSGRLQTTSFSDKLDLSVGGRVGGVSVGDLNGDGKPDIVATNYSGGVVSVFLNNSSSGTLTSGSFAARVDVTTEGSPVGVSVADLDGDGKQDIAVANYGSGKVTILRNTTASGLLSFATKVDFNCGGSPWSISAGDLAGDGKVDIAVTNSGSRSVSTLRNLSTSGEINGASFATREEWNTGSDPRFVAIADLDGNGRPELLVTNHTSNTLSVLRNRSAVSSIDFAPKSDQVTGSSPMSLSVGDLDGDGKADVAVSNYGSGTISVFLNQSTSGTVTLASKVDIVAGDNPHGLTVGDLDGDGRTDLSVVNAAENSVSLIRYWPARASACSSFTQNAFADRISVCASSQVLDAGAGATQYAWHNGANTQTITASASGRYWVLVTNAQNCEAVEEVYVSLTGTCPPASSLTFTPSSATPGASVTLSGVTFDTDVSKSAVLFGATRGVVTAAAITGTSLSVTVPVGATNGPISVTNLTTGLSAYSRKHFVPTFTGNAGTMRFSDKGLLESSKSEHISLSDLDGDGKSDLIVCQSGNVYVYQNQSLSGSLTTSSFGSKVGISFGGSVRSQLIGDLDGDGKPDIVALYSNGVDVFRNVHVSGSISGSSFDTPLTLAVGNNPGTVTLSDFDGDGKPDLVVTNTGDNTLSLFLNTSVSGTLSFASPVLLNTGLNPMYSTSGDIDGDGLSDLVLLRSETVTLLRNVSTPGNISFSSGYDISMAGIGPNGILLTDLDVDGKPDLLTCNSGNSVSVFRNTGVSAPFGSGSFSTRVDFSTDISNNIRMSVGDLDGDGLPDISLGRNDGFVGGMNVGSLSVPVLRNTSTSGTISFGSVVTIPITEDRPGAAVIGDLDGDKVPDLVVGGTDMGKLYVLRNANLDPVSLPPPAVSSFTPTSGAVGTPVTISGSEFSTTASDNVVTFGTVRVVASSSTATSLTVTVPAGAVYGPLTVTRLDRNLSGRSSASFIPTFTGTPGSVEYLPRVDKGTGDGPQSSVLSDLDGDGKAELLTGNWSGGSVSVFQNASVSGRLQTTSFSDKLDLSVGGRVGGVSVGDLNGDGKPDIVATNYSGGVVSVFLNNSSSGTLTSGSFAARVDVTTEGSPVGVSVADLDGDGKQDIAVANYGSGKVTILRNTTASGLLSFATKVDFNCGGSPWSISAGDLAGDGKVDIAVTNSGSTSVSTLRNLSTSGAINGSSFAAREEWNTGSDPRQVALADVDGDGRPELLVTNHTSNTLSVLKNISTSSDIDFSAKSDKVTGSIPMSVSVGDLDGDGKADVAVSNYGSGTVSVFLNGSTSGTITLASKVDIAAGDNPHG